MIQNQWFHNVKNFINSNFLQDPYNKVKGCLFVCLSVCLFRRISLTAEQIGFFCAPKDI